MPEVEDNLLNPSEDDLDEIEAAARAEEIKEDKIQKVMPESGASVRRLGQLMSSPRKKSRKPDKWERNQEP